MQGAWQAATRSDSRGCWRALAHAALSALDVPTAVAAFRKAQDSAMVLALERVAFLEDRHQIAGEVLAIVHCEYDAAQQMLLRSGDAAGALQMRKDLKHWAVALRLAERAEPDSVADVMSQHAATLEMKGDAAGALQVFQVSRACFRRRGRLHAHRHQCVLWQRQICRHLCRRPYSTPARRRRRSSCTAGAKRA